MPMGRPKADLVLQQTERAQLQSMARSRSIPAALRERAQIVLASAGDPRATEWLTRAHEALQTQAATIADAALRQRFLFSIPVHREIASAWAARNAT